MPHELDLHSLAEELARPDGAPPLDTAILAATAALSSAPESAGGQSAVAEALRCVVRIAERDAAGRVGPELIGLVVDRGIRPACTRTTPAPPSTDESAAVALEALRACLFGAARLAGGLLDVSPPLLSALLRGVAVPLALAAAPGARWDAGSLGAAPPGEAEEPLVGGLVELLKAAHELLGAQMAGGGELAGRGWVPCLGELSDALLCACEAEAARPSPAFKLKNWLWKLLVRAATALGRAGAPADAGDVRGDAASLSTLRSRLLSQSTARLTLLLWTRPVRVRDASVANPWHGPHRCGSCPSCGESWPTRRRRSGQTRQLGSAARRRRRRRRWLSLASSS